MLRNYIGNCLGFYIRSFGVFVQDVRVYRSGLSSLCLAGCVGLLLFVVFGPGPGLVRTMTVAVDAAVTVVVVVVMVIIFAIKQYSQHQYQSQKQKQWQYQQQQQQQQQWQQKKKGWQQGQYCFSLYGETNEAVNKPWGVGQNKCNGQGFGHGVDHEELHMGVSENWGYLFLGSL